MAGVNSAQAVHVNPDGLGQVLLFPYYTAQEGQDTYIQIVNTTNQFKAVKVRYLEAYNSREVLDFNLYLSPRDHWSALVTADANGDGAVQTTSDTSCIVPNFVSNNPVPFRNYEYSGPDGDSVDGVERTLEGYVEVIEMGEVVMGTQNWPAAIKHVNGVPGDCSVLNAAWNAGGRWAVSGDNQPADGLQPPTGGLYGYGVIINVDEGTDATYDAVALDNFNNIAFHTEPGSLDPGLDDGIPLYDVIDGNQVISGVAGPSGGASAGLNAVSALIMHDTINNDYVLEPSIDAGTDWVVTFPTKRDYVNSGVVATAPFTNIWSRTQSRACESFDAVYYDREEGQENVDILDVSPRPPGDEPISLCYEANVLTFEGSDVLGSAIATDFDLASGFDNGWMKIDFTSGRAPLVAGANSFSGLPVIGFAVQKYVNGDVGGLLSNYVGNVTHKATRSVSSAP
tara:strand:+ start:48257 stop:49618 length:1362 start_codon:yes stop_codon:yes gene_type:complete